MAYDILFVWYCLNVVIVCASGNTTAPIEIKRERYDKFSPQNVHLESQGSNQTAEKLCKSFKAKCENDECKYCQCSEEDRNTFLLLSPTTGNCTKDQDIIRDSVPNGNFFLRNQNYGECLTVNGNRTEKVSGTDCSSSLNMRWIWLNERGKIQLMNVMSLQCLEFVKSLSTCSHKGQSVNNSVVMKQCDRTNRQQITPKNMTNYIFTKMCSGQNNFYLEIDEDSKRAISKSPSRGQTWKNTDDGHLNWKTTTYKGCYRFSTDKKFMLYLDKDNCSKPCTRNFSAPIFSENSQCSIIWLESTIMRSDMMWQKVTNMKNKKPISINEVSKDLKMLLIEEEAFDIFNNSLLKLEISCKNKNNMSNKENHCLLLKFSLLKPTMTAISSTTILTAKMTDTTEIASTTTAKMTDTTEIASTTTAKMADATEIASTTTAKMADATEIASTTTAKMASTTVPVISKHKENKENSAVTIAIAVTVPVLIIILVLVVAYFYRKRLKTKRSTNNQVQGNNPSYTRVVYDAPNIYTTPGKEESPARYEYIDNAIVNPKPTQPELKYDYATNTEIPRTTLNAKPGDAAAQPDLQYDYAKDTEIPRTTLNTKPGDAAAQPDLQYDYAANTEIPELDSKPESDTPNNPLYHSLEEPSPPPTAVYATLEEPTDETKLATYDTPHSGDPV